MSCWRLTRLLTLFSAAWNSDVLVTSAAPHVTTPAVNSLACSWIAQHHRIGNCRIMARDTLWKLRSKYSVATCVRGIPFSWRSSLLRERPKPVSRDVGPLRALWGFLIVEARKLEHDFRRNGSLTRYLKAMRIMSEDNDVPTLNPNP